MSICPKDGTACCDDLCHGSGCMQMNGYPMLEICQHCKGIIDEEIPECSTCSCDDYDDYQDYMWENQEQLDRQSRESVSMPLTSTDRMNNKPVEG